MAQWKVTPWLSRTKRDLPFLQTELSNGKKCTVMWKKITWCVLFFSLQREGEREEGVETEGRGEERGWREENWWAPKVEVRPLEFPGMAPGSANEEVSSTQCPGLTSLSHPGLCLHSAPSSICLLLVLLLPSALLPLLPLTKHHNALACPKHFAMTIFTEGQIKYV